MADGAKGEVSANDQVKEGTAGALTTEVDPKVEKEDGQDKDEELSLDLADLEDLNNDTFAELKNQSQSATPEKSATSEKQIKDLVEELAESGKKAKDEAPLSILDFLSQDVAAPKEPADTLLPSAVGTATQAKPSTLDELGFLGDDLAAPLKKNTEPHVLEGIKVAE